MRNMPHTPTDEAADELKRRALQIRKEYSSLAEVYAQVTSEAAAMARQEIFEDMRECIYDLEDFGLWAFGRGLDLGDAKGRVAVLSDVGGTGSCVRGFPDVQGFNTWELSRADYHIDVSPNPSDRRVYWSARIKVEPQHRKFLKKALAYINSLPLDIALEAINDTAPKAEANPMPTVAELLSEDAKKGVVKVLQYDGYEGEPYGKNGVLEYDYDGLCVCWGSTFDLRRSDSPVRVHIGFGTHQATAISLLEKILGLVKSKNFQPGLLREGEYLATVLPCGKVEHLTRREAEVGGYAQAPEDFETPEANVF